MVEYDSRPYRGRYIPPIDKAGVFIDTSACYRVAYSMHIIIISEGRLLLWADTACFYFIRLLRIFSISWLQVGLLEVTMILRVSFALGTCRNQM